MSKSDDERHIDLENMLRHKRKMIISSIILAVFLSQFVITAVQHNRGIITMMKDMRTMAV